MATDIEEVTPIQQELESWFRRNFSRFFEPDFPEAFRRFIAKGTFCRPYSVSVGTSAVQLVALNASRIRVSIYNNGSAVIFYGGKKVTTGSAGDPNAGFPIQPNTGIIITDSVAEIWAVSLSSGMDVRIEDVVTDGI